MSERREAVALAHRVLDRPWGDPDLAVLARQFLRALEEIDAVRRSEEATEKLRARTWEILEAERDEHREILATALARLEVARMDLKAREKACDKQQDRKVPEAELDAMAAGAADGEEKF